MIALFTDPRWHNICEHHPSYFVGGVMVADEPYNNNHYDVYIYGVGYKRWDGDSGYELCFRYGNEDYEYCSPGDAVAFLKRSRDPQHTSYHPALFEIVEDHLKKLGVIPGGVILQTKKEPTP
jgi:hypothetical protein